MVYTIQENVRIVIAALKLYNIRHIVISPGGTNIPLSQAVQDDPFFKCFSVVDERSAMYFAIGLYLQTGEIIATSCTSAQATRNYVPGLTEAFYKHAPILAITTSKLQRYQYQDYMQAPNQCSLPQDAVKKSFDLPPVVDLHTRVQCQQEVRDAILELTHHNQGPVQLNIRIDDFVQGQFLQTELPIIPEIKRYMAWDKWDDVELTNKEILIIVGEHRPFGDRLINAINTFSDNFNVVIYTNHLSNYHGDHSINANLLVLCNGLKHLNPDIIISIGGQTGDYPIFYALCNSTAEHWRVSEDGNVVDTYGKLTKIFECPDYFFFEHFTSTNKPDHSYLRKWKEMNSLIENDIELPFSNLYVAQNLSQLMPQKSVINFAILNSLRCWSFYHLNSSIHCYSNVSAFGIDGCTSTMIGESVTTEELCFIVTGDLAFFYDMNSIGIRHIKNNVRILLINNGGGAEFKYMTRPWKNQIELGNYISANGHFGSAKGWAENCGFKYICSSSKEEFEENKNTFVEESGKPILFEIFTSEDNDIQAVEKLTRHNAQIFSNTNLVEKVKEKLKSKVHSLKSKLT